MMPPPAAEGARIQWGCSFPASSARNAATGEEFHAPRHTWLAWRLPFEPQAPAAKLAHWLLHCPYAHPVWERWVISLCHLRPMPGVPDAVGTGHELAIFAVDPHIVPPDPAASTLPPHCLMTPPIVMSFDQFGDDDAAAIARVERCIELTIARILSPDDDHRRYWEYLLNAPESWLTR